MYPKTFVTLALVAIGFIGAPGVQNFSTGQPAAMEKRVSTLETAVAELQASNLSLQATVTSLTTASVIADKSDVTATPEPDIKLSDASSEEQSVSTKAPVPLDASPEDAISSAMVGDASPSIPTSNSDTYQVSVLRQQESGVWLIVRNNSGETINNINVDVVARDAKGTMLAVGGASGFVPVIIAPGQISIGHIGFGSAKLPKDVDYEYDVKVYMGSDSDLLKELQIIEHSFIENRIVGIVQNPTSKTVLAPMVNLFCFDADGNFLARDGSVMSNVDPKSTEPFQIEYPENCPTYLLYASGF